jgi:hypothetical protein
MGVVNVAWKEQHVWVPKETFTLNVSPPLKTFLILLVALWEATMAFETNIARGEWCGCAPRCPRCSQLWWKS